MKNLFLCLLNVIVVVCGQILFKLSARNREITSILDTSKLIFSFSFIAAVTLYGCTTFLWIYILTKVPLSYAYPIQALSFPLILIISSLVFKETVLPQRWIGIGIMIFGAFLASR